MAASSRDRKRVGSPLALLNASNMPALGRKAATTLTVVREGRLLLH